jgi:hypothetical protein
MRIPPHAPMDEFPRPAIAEAADSVRDFSSQVAVRIGTHIADRKPVARDLAFFELRLAHAPAPYRIAWPAQALVHRHVSLRKAVSAGTFQAGPIEPCFRQGSALAFRRLWQIQLHGSANYGRHRTLQLRRDFSVRHMREFAAHARIFLFRPQPAADSLLQAQSAGARFDGVNRTTEKRSHFARLELGIFFAKDFILGRRPEIALH